jgi:hypothetical protein
MVRWRGLNKINVHRIYNLQFFNDHRASCLWFMKHYQTKGNWKIMQCPSIKFPSLWYGIGFFLRGRYNYAFITLKNAKKHIFWMKFHPIFLKFYIVLDSINVYQYHTP